MKKRVNSNNWTRHTNPDGTLGGLVSTESKVGSGVVVDVNGVVLSGAVVPDDTVVEAGELFTKDGPVRFAVAG